MENNDEHETYLLCSYLVKSKVILRLQMKKIFGRLVDNEVKKIFISIVN